MKIDVIVYVIKNEHEVFQGIDRTRQISRLKDGVKYWIIPSIESGVYVDPESEEIKKYSLEDYKNNVLPLFDVTEEIEDI